MQEHTDQFAALAAGASAAGAGISWLSEANEIVQFVAGIVAVFSGLAAAYYYIRKAHQKKD